MNTTATILHQTSLWDEKAMNDNSVLINEDIFISVLNLLAKEKINGIAQPCLIIGESGSGKTYLLHRLYQSLQTDNDRLFRPVFIEGRTLFSTDDIWKQCASFLSVNPSTVPYDDICRWQEEHACRIVLFVDNIQYYFERTKNHDHFNLRGKLNRSGAPVLVATSDRVLPAFTDYDAAFFEGFKISYIKPLILSEFARFIDSQLKMSRLEKLMAYLPKTPRSLYLATDILRNSSGEEMDLILLQDYFSQYYQIRYDGYLTQVQRILSVLARTENGASLQEIRNRTGQEGGKLSPYLKMMTDQKVIEKTSKNQRGGTYTIVDPLFKLWLQTNAS